MPNTWTKIVSGNFSGGGATISSIPSTYTDLAIVLNARDTIASSGSNFIRVRFNSDAGTNYSGTLMNASNTTPVSSRVSGDTVGYAGWINYGNNTTYSYASSIMYIPNYLGSTFKSWQVDASPEWLATTGVWNFQIAGLWRNTAAINRMDFFPASSFESGTTFTLYGIKNTP